ncbi:MAG: type II secretion system protein GspD [Verrucomicrobia bacterium]|nr:type II secretion system protein GspD [Verrucomicrobiota bacterium]
MSTYPVKCESRENLQCGVGILPTETLARAQLFARVQCVCVGLFRRSKCPFLRSEGWNLLTASRFLHIFPARGCSLRFFLTVYNLNSSSGENVDRAVFAVLKIIPYLIVLLLVTSCASSNNGTAPKREIPPPKPKAEARRTSTQVKPPPRVDPAPKQPTTTADNLFSPKVSSHYDTEIKAVLSLASAGKWEEAQQKADLLQEQDPNDASIRRTAEWVSTQRQAQRDKALEDRIRAVDSKQSVFNPTLPGLLLENKNRGLPPRHDVRRAIGEIQATPYVPESFNRTRYEKGLLFDLEAPEGRMAKVLSKDISVHLDNVSLEAIIFNIGQAEGINFVADKSLAAFKQTLSVNMDKVKLSEFLRYVSRNLDVQFQVGDDLIWIVDANDPKRLLEETRFYRLRKGFILPAQFAPTEVNRIITSTPAVTTTVENQKIERFVNDNASTNPAVAQAFKEFFKGSKFMIDYERNLIVATGTHEQLEVAEKIIHEFDRPIQQVLIEARFITVTEAAFLQLGASWETDRGQLGAGRVPQDFTGLGAEAGAAGLGFQKSFTALTNVFDQGELTATLTALEQSGESQTLSAPRLTVLNNLPARISDGKIQYYYEEYQVKQTILERRSSSTLVPSGKPTKITSGVSLDVMASIGNDGQTILLGLHPEVNQDVRLVTFATVSDFDDAGRVVSSFDIKLPESRTQSLATRMAVRSGQTVVMGGVLEREQRTFVDSIPILSRIPILGAAFRKRTEVDRPRYLLIFVTATLLADTGEFLVYEDTEPTR